MFIGSWLSIDYIMSRYFQIVLFTSLLLVFISCSKKRNEMFYDRLQQWDNLVDINPKLVTDSLALFEYASDTTMKVAIDYCIHNKEYIRELINQVIVSKRMNNIYIILAMFLVFMLLFLFLYFRKRCRISLVSEEKSRFLEAERRLLSHQNEQQCKMLTIFGDFLSEYALILNKARALANKVKISNQQLGQEYDVILNEGQQHFNDLASRFFTDSELEKRFVICCTSKIFSKSERLLLFMLESNIPNSQIAALLNTSTYNLKTRKSQLKKKIEQKATPENHFSNLFYLFTDKKTHKKG